MQGLPPLRNYQREAVETAVLERCNTLIVLPTGSGKTRIAAEVIAQTGPPCIFFVPTNVLVDQQADALRPILPPTLKIGKLNSSNSPWRDIQQWGAPVTGGAGGTSPSTAVDILVTTPQMFINEFHLEAALNDPNTTGPFLAEQLLCRLSLIIFDEVHHCVGEHPYKTIAKVLSECRPSNQDVNPPAPQIIGLTAHPTYKKDPHDIAKATEHLFGRLRLDNFCTAMQEDLVRDGYAPGWRPTGADVKSYDLYMSQAQVWRNPQPERRVEAYIEAGLKRFSPGGDIVPAPENHCQLVDIVLELENIISSQVCANGIDINASPCPSFVSDILCGGKPPTVSEWGATAKKGGGPGRELVVLLEDWYEGLRIAAVGGPDSTFVGLAYLEMQNTVKTTIDKLRFAESTSNSNDIGPLIAKLMAFSDKHVCISNKKNKRLEHLKQVLLERAREVETPENEDGTTSVGKELRAIIFVDQSIVTEVLVWFIRNDPQLRGKIGHVQAAYSSNKPAAASFKMHKDTTDDRVQQFHSGICKVLVATNLLEEGIDVAKANGVFRFDPVTNAVSHVQGGGRARDKEGKETVLTELHPDSTKRLDEAVELGRREAETFLARYKHNAEYRSRMDELNAHIMYQLEDIRSRETKHRHLPCPSACVPPPEDQLPKTTTSTGGVGQLRVDIQRLKVLAPMVDAAQNEKTPLMYFNEQKGRARELHLTEVAFTLTPPPAQGRPYEGSMQLRACRNKVNQRFKFSTLEEWDLTVAFTVPWDDAVVVQTVLKTTTFEKVIKHACIEEVLCTKLGKERWTRNAKDWTS